MPVSQLVSLRDVTAALKASDTEGSSVDLQSVLKITSLTAWLFILSIYPSTIC